MAYPPPPQPLAPPSSVSAVNLPVNLLGCPADLLIIDQEVEEVEMEDNVAVEHELEDAVEEFSVIQDKAEDKEVFKCSSCEKTFIFVKSYERHVGQCGAREGTKVVESSGESSGEESYLRDILH